MENTAVPPEGKEVEDDAEVVDVAKKKKKEEKGEEKKKEKDEEESDEKKKGKEEGETPRSLKTMSPSEKVCLLVCLLLFLFTEFVC